MHKEKILLVLTGGTICSVEDTITHKRASNADSAKRKITENFRKSQSEYASAAEFCEHIPIDVLSENMTAERLNTLISFLSENISAAAYKGIVILHGTDTPAFSSSLLSLLLCGIDVPVFIVSSHSPLDSPNTNGNDNFRCAVDLIIRGIAPNVYFVYKNSDGNIYLHYGAHLLQCQSYSQDFFSADAVKISENAVPDMLPFETNGLLVHKIGKLSPSVLRISPYVGINYNSFNLDGISVVVHETFHSQTACAEISCANEKYSEFSVLYMIERCKNAGIPFILSPCSESSFSYESTSLLLSAGAVPIYGMTHEMTYIKALVGVSLGLKGDELIKFINKSINREFIERF